VEPYHPAESLNIALQRLNGKDYATYQSLIGIYAYDRFQLHIKQIPKDPYAPPGTGDFRVMVSRADAAFPETCFASKISTIAFRDFLARQFHRSCVQFCAGRRGTGNSGLITIAEPGQEIQDRTSIRTSETSIEVRLFIGFPASGRSINAQTARTMLFQELPRIVESGLFASNTDLDALEKHIHTSEDAEALRMKLAELGLDAFIADGSILPRASGIDPRPLCSQDTVPFKSPENLRMSIELPHAGRINGMGIPEGVTLIVGGGYHGKSTLLHTLELGIYNHIPGDGRELCVSVPATVKVRASSGRCVTHTDISAFINNLPLKQDTASFVTENASGSTSQAAYISEAIEAGARVLLMDEDTCAANFMIRDNRMQRLVTPDQEPITAFVDRVKQLHRDLGISTILVMGGSGDYFDVADCIIQMADFKPRDVTQTVLHIIGENPCQRIKEGSEHFPAPRQRAPIGDTLEPRNEYGHFRISARDPHHLVFGKNQIDFPEIEQITETAQAQAIGYAIEYAKKYMDGHTPIRTIINQVMADIDQLGLDVISPRCVGNLAAFRGLDLAGVLNRIRGLIVRQV
jgi:predicted ABC-class ATPase